MLPGISTEQLRSRLNRMVADGMLTRKRYREMPPRVDYELTERAGELAPVLGELARWGYEWAWGPPRRTELVDVGAIFRLLPGLAAAAPAAEGRVTLTVLDGRPMHYVIAVSADGTTVSETAEEIGADAALSGTTAAWVQALGPVGDPSGLTVSGREELRAFVLGLLSPGRGEAAPAASAESAAS